jgi:hypothetical protein
VGPCRTASAEQRIITAKTHAAGTDAHWLPPSIAKPKPATADGAMGDAKRPARWRE